MSHKTMVVTEGTYDVMFPQPLSPSKLFPRLQELHKGKKVTPHSLLQAFFQVVAEERTKAPKPLQGKPVPCVVLVDEALEEADECTRR